MILIISFYAGGSGNFLADFLATDQGYRIPSFRLDSSHEIQNPRRIFLSGGSSTQDKRLIDNTSSSKIAKHLEEILADPPEQILTHYSDVTYLKSIVPSCEIIKIYPVTNIFGLLKNCFFKKQEVENTSYRCVEELGDKIDRAFINITDHYFKIKQDNDLNYIVDFGKLYDLNFLTSLYQEYNGFYPDEFKIDFARQYIDSQFPAIHDSDSTKMEDIIEFVNPKDYFDLGVCLFIFEKNNNTIDKNRLWTIDNIPSSVNEAIQFLKINSKNYSLN